MSSTTAEAGMPRLKAKYLDTIKPELRSEFELENVMQVPGLVKVVVNMGVATPRAIPR